MPLSVGDKLGPYEILAPIGAGGMGEVYRAKDSKLKRDIALKVLPEAFARDPERMARFQREAEVLASLNHPNIASIYGVEDRALVMELVEGDSPKGPMAFDDAWRIASQIAAALDYAHEKGIIHRDLKPANLKITPDGVVKLLDFGLAKAFSGPTAAPSSDPANSPTLTMGATAVGVILGTAAYMPPEQAKGKSVDKRADIWAFGVVLYELLTGDRLFKGEDASDTLVEVLTKQPDLEKVPIKARRLLRECLEKDPKHRLRDIGDCGRLLEEPSEVVTARKPPLLWIAAAATAVLIAGVAAFGWWRATRPLEQPLTQFSVDLGPDAMAGLRTTVAISRDGWRIAYPTKNGLATRTLDKVTTTLLSGTTSAEDPFFSPDGRWIGFFADGSLKKVEVQGGAPLTLCPVINDRGGGWGDDGSIVFTPNSTAGFGLMRVSEAGGTPQPLGKLEARDISHRWPQVLPGAKAVLFTSTTQAASYDAGNIEVLSLKTGQRKNLVRGGYFGRYVPAAGGGYLVYVHEGTLFGVPFDIDRLELRGTATPMLEGVASDPGSGGGQLDISDTGVLVYRGGKGAAGRTVAWLDNMGRTTPFLTKPGIYWTPRFSPDGKRLAYLLTAGKAAELFAYDIERDTPTQLSFNAPGATNLAWTPDGKHLVYGTNTAPARIWWVRADGSGEPQQLLESKKDLRPESFAPDGKRLAYVENTEAIMILPLDLSDAEHPKPGKPEPFLTTGATENDLAFSHDGHWMAYTANESGGRFEVYVRPFSSPGKWKISTEGGRYPVWSSNGHELLFMGGDGRVMVSEYTIQNASFTPGKPRAWSPTTVVRTDPFPNFDLHPDGKRVVVFPGEEIKGNLHATFLLNFADELRRRVPMGK